MSDSGMDGAENSSTLAGIITYNPEIKTLIALASSLVQNCDVIIFDNDSLNYQEISDSLKGWGKVRIHRSANNIGLASAANEIFRLAKQSDYEFVALFDQDSLPDDDYIKVLQRQLKEIGEGCSEISKVAAIAGIQYCRFSGADAPFIRYSRFLPEKIYLDKQEECKKVDFLITSGCLFPISSIDRIGMFDEALFIDNVDVEWSSRAVSAGYLLLASGKTRFSHCIGDDVYKLFGKVIARKHSPIRSYYSVRNLLALCRRDYVNVVWKVNSIIRAILKAGLVMLSKDRIDYLTQIVRAIRDSKKISSEPQKRSSEINC